MSLSDEERRIIVDLEIEKANRTYDAAHIMVDNEHWESPVKHPAQQLGAAAESYPDKRHRG